MIKKTKKANYRLHKTLFMVFFAICIASRTGVECQANEAEYAENVKDAVDDVIEDFDSVIPEGIDGVENVADASERVGIKQIAAGIYKAVKGQGGAALAFLTSLLGIGIISAISSVSNNELSSVSSRAIGVVAAAILLERLTFLILGSVETLKEVGSFFEAIIPITLAVNSLGVSPTTAATQAMGMGFTLSLYSVISESLILPVVSAIFVCSAASSIDPIFERISKGIKGVFLWVMGIFTALIGATFSLQSVISATADGAAIRSAKYAISGTIPIVGNTVSSAIGIIAGGVCYLRGLVGGGAIAVVIALTLSPLVILLLYRLCMKAGVFFSAVCAQGGCSGVLSAFLSAIDVLIAAYTLSVTLYVVELVAFLKGGVNLA